MIKFRRTIAIFVLMLFTCQSVLAGIGKHQEFWSDSEGMDAVGLGTVDQNASSKSDPNQPGTSDSIDGECCHAYGHCHLLAFAGPVANVVIPSGLSAASPHAFSYHSQYLDTLLRPPTRA